MKWEAIAKLGRELPEVEQDLHPARIDRSLASRGAAANDPNMLVRTGGRRRSEAGLRALYAASEFRLA